MSSNSKHAFAVKRELVEPSVSGARKLPIEVVDLQRVKIGEDVYTLDRSIMVPSEDDDGAARPTKTAKKEEHYLEIKWENYDFDAEPEVTHKYSMFADEIPEGEDFAMSRVFQDDTQKSEEGENHEHDFTLCLVDSKSASRKILVAFDVTYWTVPINLMHLNQLSQDLANFCRYLWKASGRDENDYSDMAIEFGNSPYCRVKISTLVEEATGIDRHDVMYISGAKVHEGSSSQDTKKLLRMIYTTFPASAISFEVDLKTMGIADGEHDDFGFKQLRYYPCFVGPISEI